MADVTAKMVKELREMTGVGMMDAKKALVDLILTDLSLNFERINADILKISKVPTPIFWSNFEACLYSS